MDMQKAAILAITARVLTYPSATFLNERESVLECIENFFTMKKVKQEVIQAVETIYRVGLRDLQETYVATFDLEEKSGLYLTAHEFGDSPKRGAALVHLQKIINETGFEIVDKELADFIPMLYEWLSITDESVINERLQKRLTYATQRIYQHVPKENPYKKIFSVLIDYVFGKMSNDEIKKLEQNREAADLEELPYPIMYGS